MKTDIDTDIVVAGGGPAGLMLTVLLAAAGFSVACVDREDPKAQKDPAFDGRAIAVSYGSRKVFEAAGLWDALAPRACPIETIHITDGDSPVLLEFGSGEAGGRTLGWICEIGQIRRALFARVAGLKKAVHIAPAAIAGYEREDGAVAAILEDGRRVRAKLVAGADGRGSFTREWMGIGTRGWPYNQTALVCNVLHENPHGNVALENFRPEGPFAILPMADDGEGRHRSSIVWAQHGGKESPFLRCPQDVFDAALAARFPASYGAVRLDGKRFAYPLGLIHAHRYTGQRMVLVADAAHGMHPIAGQGLNMGLRDVAELAGILAGSRQAGGKDPGDPALLDLYQRRRRFDNMAMMGATDALTRLFSNDFAPVRLARRAGLRAVARLPFARRFFMAQAMGSAGLLPALIRDAEAA